MHSFLLLYYVQSRGSEQEHLQTSLYDVEYRLEALQRAVAIRSSDHLLGYEIPDGRSQSCPCFPVLNHCELTVGSLSQICQLIALGVLTNFRAFDFHPCRRPSWRRILRLDKAVLSVALLAIALASTPDEKHFVNFVREYTQRGLGFLPGPLSGSLCGALCQDQVRPAGWGYTSFVHSPQRILEGIWSVVCTTSRIHVCT